MIWHAPCSLSPLESDILTGGVELGGDDYAGGNYVEGDDGSWTWVPDFGDLAIDPSGRYPTETSPTTTTRASP